MTFLFVSRQEDWVTQISIASNVNRVCYISNVVQAYMVNDSSIMQSSITDYTYVLKIEKALNKMPGAEEHHIKAEIVLEINIDHPLAARIKELFESDKDKLATYSKILLAQARLVSGVPLDNPAEISDLVCSLML